MDQDPNDKFLRNVTRWQAGLAAKGPPAAASFAVGALASSASFWLLAKFTSALSPNPAGPLTLLLSALRILLIGVALFAIIQNYELQSTPAVTGILIVVAAITIEVLRNSFYA